MKADVFPALPGLGIPSWVPELIAQSARARCAAAIDLSEEVLELLKECVCLDRVLTRITEHHLSLACDPRMERVWWELSRPSNGAFLYPARGSSAATAQERQDAAMLDLFNTMVACRNKRWATTTTRGEAEQQRDHDLAKANELRAEALRMLLERRLRADRAQECCQKLLDAAQAYEDSAREIYASSIAMAGERQHDGRARWVALTIAEKLRTLFGLPMYKLTAIITSVVLDRDIDPGTVRYWCDALVPPCS
jgi:hypothetical protein